jgi:hypothetical protein
LSSLDKTFFNKLREVYALTQELELYTYSLRDQRYYGSGSQHHRWQLLGINHTHYIQFSKRERPINNGWPKTETKGKTVIGNAFNSVLRRGIMSVV